MSTLQNTLPESEEDNTTAEMKLEHAKELSVNVIFNLPRPVELVSIQNNVMCSQNQPRQKVILLLVGNTWSKDNWAQKGFDSSTCEKQRKLTEMISSSVL